MQLSRAPKQHWSIAASSNRGILMHAANLLIPPAVVNNNRSRSTEQLGLDPNDGSATCSLEFQILSSWLFHIGIKIQ